MNERLSHIRSNFKERFYVPIALLFYALSISVPSWVLIPDEGYVSLWYLFATKMYILIWVNQIVIGLGIALFLMYFILFFLLNLKCCKSCNCCVSYNLFYLFTMLVLYLGLALSVSILWMDSCKPQSPCFSFYCYVFGLLLTTVDCIFEQKKVKMNEIELLESNSPDEFLMSDDDEVVIDTQDTKQNDENVDTNYDSKKKSVFSEYLYWGAVLIGALAILCWQIAIMVIEGPYVARKYDDIFIRGEHMQGITVKDIVTTQEETDWINQFEKLRNDKKFNIGFVLSHAFYIWDHMGPIMSICKGCKIFYCDEIVSKHRNEKERMKEAKMFGFDVTEVTFKELIAWTEETDSKNVLLHMGVEKLEGKKNVLDARSHGIDEDGYIHGYLTVPKSYKERDSNQIYMVWSRRWLSFRKQIHENLRKKIENLSNGKEILVRFATWYGEIDTTRDLVLPEIKKLHQELEEDYQIFYKTHPLMFQEKKDQNFAICNCFPKDSQIKISADVTGLSILEWTEKANVIISSAGSTQTALGKFVDKPVVYEPGTPLEPFWNRREADAWNWKDRMLSSQNVSILNEFKDLKINIKGAIESVKNEHVKQKRRDYLTNLFGDVNGYGEYLFLMNLIQEQVDVTDTQILGLKESYGKFKDVNQKIWA